MAVKRRRMALSRRKSGSRFEAYVIGADRDSWERMGLILELRYGQGLTPTQIRSMYKVPKTSIFRALKLYKPKQGKRDISISIMSAI